jgi:ATP/maltotriose-dependent transcriptional regulator MalT
MEYEMRKIVIEINADWIESLTDRQDADAILQMLDGHKDALYDYIDDAILDMIDRDERESA